MNDKVNLAEALASSDEAFQPHSDERAAAPEFEL